MKIIYLSFKRLIYILSMSAVIVATFMISLSMYYQTLEAMGFPTTGKVIVIDPGHGGEDPGAVSPGGTEESHINLAIAKRLKEYLEQDGTMVIMTREDDRGLYDQGGTFRQRKLQDLERRRQIVIDSNADLFISIHINKFPQSKYYGAQTFYLTGDQEAERLAKIIQARLIEVLGRNNKRQAKASNDYYILKDNNAVSVLVECGFLSNAQEEMLLKDAQYQDKIAWAIYTGIVEYLSSVQN
ncbi:MAG: N-acetylmuramoyl-L-alanine amidase CwlD [Mahellales bacterium]|jgi:N-acetylmuramoyl-L-alanine amidase